MCQMKSKIHVFINKTWKWNAIKSTFSIKFYKSLKITDTIWQAYEQNIDNKLRNAWNDDKKMDGSI